MFAISNKMFAISNKMFAISNKMSAISYKMFAISNNFEQNQRKYCFSDSVLRDQHVFTFYWRITVVRV